MAVPINSLPTKITRTPASKWNTDVAPINLNNGDYPDRQNVEYNADGEMFTDTPALGNRLVASIPQQDIQQQVTRIFLDPLFTSITITLKNVNGQTLGFGSTTSVSDLLSNKAAIVSVISGFSTPAIFTDDTNLAPYINVQFDNQYSGFVLELTDQDGQPIDQTEIQEAVSITGAGNFNVIGKYQLNTALFVYSTTQDQPYESIGFIQGVFRIGNVIFISFPLHGLQTNQSVVVSNCEGVGAAANGEWTVTVVDANTFSLNFSSAGAITILPVDYGGELFINPYGVGQIGVMEYIPDGDAYTYTKLIASRRFNFNVFHQIDVTGEVNNKGYLLKYTDFYNPPRTFTYNGEFVDNGALEVFNPIDGIYRYDNLADTIKNLINYSQAIVKFEQQIQSGGSVPSGNWLYGVRFITSSGSPSELSLLSLPVPVFSPVYEVNTDIVYGNAVGNNTTGKINRVRVTGIEANRFEFIELIGFNYGNSIANSVPVQGIRIRREQLDPATTEIVLEHNGNEVDSVLFDAALGTSVRPDIIKVGSNRIIDNRLVYGKIATSTSIDIREWVATFKYSIKRYPLYGSFGAETFYEFFDPANTQYAGYQKWEWYRIYVAPETKTGIISDAVFAFDVRFVSQADYDPNEFIDTNLTDRRYLPNDEFVDYAMGSGASVNDGRDIYQYYLELNNVDWNYRIDGIAVSDLFRSIKIVRAERIEEVISDGVFIGSVNISGGALTDFREAAELATNYFLPFGVSANPFFGSFYSPDIIFGLKTYEWQSDDELINIGMNNVVSTLSSATGGGTFDWWGISGYENGTTQAQRIKILESQFVTAQGAATFGTTPYVKLTAVYPASYCFDSPVLRLDAAITNPSGNPDRAVFQTLLFRRRVNKYGDRDSIGNNLIFTGATLFSGESEVDVFGGDVFAQQVQFKHITRTANTASAQGFNITSSNRINVNLRAYNPDTPTNAFPINPTAFGTWLATAVDQDFTKNIGYSIVNTVQSLPTYNAYNKDNGLYPTRKFWSQLSPNNSQIDRYREFLPLDFQDSPNVYGDITHLENINGELFTFQQYQFSREFFNQTGVLTTQGDGSVIIGNGSVLSRDGVRNTRRGTTHKWAVILGYSDSGRDVCYWFDSSTASVMRFGADGSQNLTARAFNSTWIRQRTRFIKDDFSPAAGQGIHGIWDDIGKNYILTCRAWDKTIREWNSLSSYPEGAVVSYLTNQGIPVFYQSVQANNSSHIPLDNPKWWTLISFSNHEYYNVWTVVFNEMKNAFTHRYTWFPKIYLFLDNRYFSPSPYDSEGSDIYRHRDELANTLTFYGREEEGFTEYVFNPYASINKKFNALGYVARLKPFKVEVQSQFISQSGIEDRITFMLRDTDGDMEMRENNVLIPIKNNLDSNGSPDEDTAPMRGLYALIRTYFKANENQNINDITVNYRMGYNNVQNT